MGTITTLKSKTKGTRYKAIIQIRKTAQGINYFDSATFSTRPLAKQWMEQEEKKLEQNPHLLTAGQPVKSQTMTLGAAIDAYLLEVTGFGKSKRMTLKMITRLPIASKPISGITRQDYAAHANARRNGDFNEYGLNAVAASTANMDLQYIRTILNHADLVWGIDVKIEELEKAVKGLRKARVIGDSEERARLPSSDELQRITTAAFSYFYMTNYNDTPIHLIMWLAIYTGRRLTELTRLKLKNYDREHQRWLLEDIKDPNGSAGNNKYFMVDDRAEQVVDLLLEPKLRERLLRRGGNPEVLIPFARETIDRQFQNLKEVAGVDDLHFHDFRHEAATRLAEKGFTIPQIQQYTLHEDWNSLKVYVNLNTIRKTVLDFNEAIEVAKNAKLSELIG